MSQEGLSLVGRPRLYGDNSQKMAAFRDRQASSGYLRRELLLSPAAAESVKAIAAGQGVSAIDVTSALFEMGLAQYQAAGYPSRASQGVSAVSTSLQGAAPQLAALVAAPVDPINLFFNRRKDANHA